MADLAYIRSQTQDLMFKLGEEHLGQGLTSLGWTFYFDHAKRRMGSCRIREGDKQITLSRHFAERNGWSVMEDVARHEIAHALDLETRGKTDHSSTWKAWAIRCGADPTRTYEGADVEEAPYKYVAECPNECGYELGFYRKISRWYVCPECSQITKDGMHAFLHVRDRNSGKIIRKGGIGVDPKQTL